MKVYVAGPMRHYPAFNFPAFDLAATWLRAQGHEVISPAEMDRELGFNEHQPEAEAMESFDLADALKRDIAAILGCEAIYLLRGWRNSAGANLELTVARAIGLEEMYEEAVDESAAQEAHRLVHGNRGADYGHPIHDFTRTGRMWGAVLGIPDVAPELVGLCMATVKISREVNAPKRDNRVDLAGYAETVQMIHDARGA